MTPYLLSLVLIVCTSMLRGEQSAPSIDVALNRSTSLHPLFIAPFHAPVPSTYLDQLQKTLCSDLIQSGSFECRDNPQGIDRLTLQCMTGSLEAHYEKVVKTTLMKKSFLFPPLTGCFQKDRQIIHQVADRLHDACIGQPGIASAQIFYTLDVNSGGTSRSSEIWRCDYDGGYPHCLLRESGDLLSPVPLNNATQPLPAFFYVNYRNGPPKIYLAQQNRQRQQSFIPLAGNQLLPSLSRKGDLLAFICDVHGQADLFIQPLQRDYSPLGNPTRIYSFPLSVQASPTISPDGQKIAFVSDREGTPLIYLIDLRHVENSGFPPPICLTRRFKTATSPTWSPDGKRIAFSAKQDGVRQIFVYNLRTRQHQQLTWGSEHKENPDWAPNSRHLVFNTISSKGGELFLLDSESRCSSQITHGVGKKHYPKWSGCHIVGD